MLDLAPARSRVEHDLVKALRHIFREVRSRGAVARRSDGRSLRRPDRMAAYEWLADANGPPNVSNCLSQDSLLERRGDLRSYARLLSSSTLIVDQQPASYSQP